MKLNIKEKSGAGKNQMVPDYEEFKVQNRSTSINNVNHIQHS